MYKRQSEFRALAGGVTAARLLHGSANVVGGQDAVVKLKYGRTASEQVIADAAADPRTAEKYTEFVSV